MKINIGGVEVLVEDIDHYLQINDICGTDLSRIWEQVKTDYASYDKWICYHNSEIPFVVLDEINAVLEDDCIETRLIYDELNYPEKLDIARIERVTEEGFDEFATYHGECNPDMYWTSERIRRDLSRWGIFSLRTINEITGYILLGMRHPVEAEIFCVDAPDSVQYEALIAFAAKFAFDNGRKEVLYMTDNPVSHGAALSIGFAVTGFYKGYLIRRT